jgi:hypothetical protein
MGGTNGHKSRVNSAVVIARLLGTEGFTEHVANEVKRYWMHRSGLTDRQYQSIVRLKKEFGAIMHELDEGERLIVGNYVGLLMRQQFDTGLKIGIQTIATLNEHEVDASSHSVPLVRKSELETVPMAKYKTVKGELRKTHELLKEARREKESTVKQEHGPLPAEAGGAQEAREGEAG